jgi:hypothetical protein
MSAKACQCNEPNPNCLRAGVPMVGRLWELCRGVNCDATISQAYRDRWQGQTRPPCRHKGEQIGTFACPDCAGSVRLKVFECRVHVDCTVAVQIPGHACCSNCPDYSEISDC